MLRKTVFCFLLLLAAPLWSQTRPSPGLLSLSGEWLYFKPSLEQTYYVINSNNASFVNGERSGNKQGSHSGYRAEALYRFANCQTELRVRWTHIPYFSDSDSVSGRFLYAVFAMPVTSSAGDRGIATLKETFNVFCLDCLFGQKIAGMNGPFTLSVQGGLQYGYVHFLENLNLKTNNLFAPNRLMINKSRVSGAGPMVGADFNYDIFKWLSVAGRGSTALLISDRYASTLDKGSTPPSLVTNSVYHAIVPTANLRFGLNIHTPFNLKRWFDCCSFSSLGCSDICIEAGYEMLVFCKSVDRLFFTDDIEIGSSIDELMNLGFYGPYVQVGISF